MEKISDVYLMFVHTEVQLFAKKLQKHAAVDDFLLQKAGSVDSFTKVDAK